MSKVSTNISLDADLKKASQELFADLGMDLTTAVTIFLKQSLRAQGLPFSVAREKPHVPNETTLAAIREGDALLADTSTRGCASINDLKAALEL